MWLDITETEHRARPEPSPSAIKWLRESPAAYQWHRDHHEQTPAMRLGTAVHTAILQPEIYSYRYVVRPEGIDGRTKDGRAWAEAHAGMEILSAEDGERVSAMAESVTTQPQMREWLASPHARREQSALWNVDCGDGYCVELKGRLDLWVAYPGIVVDVKTAASVEYRALQRSTHELGYYIQLALYADAARASCVLEIAPPCVICAICSAPPYGCELYEVDPAYLDAGMAEARRLLRLWADCEASGQWPRDGRDTQPIHPMRMTAPRWAMEG